MTRLRPYRPDDRRALGEICVRTGDAGGDATGLLSDDDIWPALFAWPYAARHPDAAFVVADEDDRAAGYLVATPDTDEFERWFRTTWWPPYARRFASAASPRDTELLEYAAARGSGPDSLQAVGYPAHLHIDLLPALQGQGWGRRLIATGVKRLAQLGATGVHLTAGAANTGAIAFYPRVGFVPLRSDEGARSFGMRLAAVTG